VVTEVNPVRAIEATMDGYRVMPMLEAAKTADIIVTTTGNIHIVDANHLEVLKDRAVIANSGHFNVEINIPALEAKAVAKRRMREFVDEYTYPDGRRVYLLGEGRLINLAAAEGHPASVMDMSFANQALCAEYVAQEGRGLQRKVYKVPEHIDKDIARLKLSSMGVQIDELTAEQEQYLAAWEAGT
ncbi:MAG: adenosylhomocysteinase, partial [Chloroflexi bacterium]|nr:adenosylhomocysteinase [Chloroflexota bacterium]